MTTMKWFLTVFAVLLPFFFIIQESPLNIDEKFLKEKKLRRVNGVNKKGGVCLFKKN